MNCTGSVQACDVGLLYTVGVVLGQSVQGVWSQAGLYRGCGVELVCTGGVVSGWSVQGVWSWAGLYRGCGLGLVCTGGVVSGWSVQGVWSRAGLYRGCGLGLVCTGGVVSGWSVQGVWSQGWLYRGWGKLIGSMWHASQNTTTNLSTIVHVCPLHVQVHVCRMHTCDPYIRIHVLCCLCQPFYSLVLPQCRWYGKEGKNWLMYRKKRLNSMKVLVSLQNWLNDLQRKDKGQKAKEKNNCSI